MRRNRLNAGGWRLGTVALASVLTFTLIGCGQSTPTSEAQPNDGTQTNTASSPTTSTKAEASPDKTVPDRSKAEASRSSSEKPEKPSQPSSAASIADGLYIMGGTDQGLEVRGDQYRYYDEGGEHEWRPTASLTAIGDGLIFDGENYWCIIQPNPEPGVCTADGWRSATQSEISHDEFILGGIELGDTEAIVIEKLGQPSNTTRTPYSTQLEYPGFMTYLDEGGTVIEMTSTNPQFCTPSNLCPGMDFAEVEALYGPPVVNDREDGRYMEYYAPSIACWIKMGLAGTVVEEITVECMI